MGSVRVTFDYEPEDPDEGDRTGMTAEEFDRLSESLMELGAMNLRVEKV